MTHHAHTLLRILAGTCLVGAIGLTLVAMTPPRHEAVMTVPWPTVDRGLQLSMSAHNAERAEALVQQVAVAAYALMHAPAQQRHARSAVEISEAQRQLADRIEAMRSAIASSPADERGTSSAPTANTARHQRQLTQLHAAIGNLRSELAQLDQQGSAVRMHTEPLLPVSHRQARDHYNALLRTYTDSHPAVRESRERLASIEQQSGMAQGTVRIDASLLREALHGELSRLQQRADVIQARLGAHAAAQQLIAQQTSERQALEAELAAANHQLAQLEAAQADLEDTRRQLAQAPAIDVTLNRHMQTRQLLLSLMGFALLLVIVHALLLGRRTSGTTAGY